MIIRRSPAERYLKYLLCHGKKYTNDQIIVMCQFAQISSLGFWYLDRLRGELKPPPQFFPHDKNHPLSVRWLLKNGLYTLFHPDQSVMGAMGILKSPRIKEFTEAMILSSAPPAAIAHALTRQKGFACTEQEVARYKFFFWDVDLLDSTEMRALLQFEVDQVASHTEEGIRSQHDSLKRAFYTDARRTAADLPFSPLSALLSQMRLGTMPSKLDLAKVLEAGRYIGALRAFESAYNNGPKDSEKYINYTNGVAKITDTLEAIVKPDEDLREQLASIALRNDTAELPFVDDVTQGNHTMDMNLLEEHHELPAGADDGDGSEGSPLDGGGAGGEGEDLP